MRIVIVIDQYDNENNGTTVSAARFVSHLRARGHEVRICATGKPGPDKYVMKTHIFPIIDPLISSQGMQFGRAVESELRRAFEGADIVHLYLPFRLEMRAREIAEEMGIPYMSAFHCQPENVTYNIGMKYLTPLAHGLYWWFRHRFYRYVNHIHCPTKFIAGQLEAHGYAAELHVISNGADEAFRPVQVEKPAGWQDRFVVMMIGRLSREKRQDLIIKAAMRSKYSGRIQLVFAGNGPRKKYYARLGRKLENPPVFGYYSKDKLIQLINQCDLYVHAAEAEIEAISCIEAFSCGLVPVIADSKLSATPQFALSANNLFRNKSVSDLVRKMEYWIEHPAEKEAVGKEYVEYAQQYRVTRSAEKMEEVYRLVIAEHQESRKRAEVPEYEPVELLEDGFEEEEEPTFAGEH